MAVDDLLARLRELNISHALLSENSKDRMLDAPFSMSMSVHCPADESESAIIDIFTPKLPKSDPSQTPSSPGSYQSPSFDVFVAMRSRVVRFYNLPPMAESYLSAMFLSKKPPVSMWTMQDEGPFVREIWVVFQTHEEARAALAFRSSSVSIAPALESDLEPYHKLQPFALKPISRHFSHVESQVPAPSNLHQPPKQPTASQIISIDTNPPSFLSPSPSFPDLQGAIHLMPDTSTSQKHDYPISTNPPNPRSNFRIGDWICTSAKCGAHNFGRNLVCIGCGSSRVNNASPMSHPFSNPVTARAMPSPRFAIQNNTRSQTPATPQGCTFFNPYSTPFVNESTVNLSKSQHPLLTPSGRGFALGGRVRNISSDPLTPCIMYWPDNEPLPEQGQIRPNGLAAVPHPPILNTGNRGPISHQPGDWVCQKCNYLNWRRRKVCQTCLPYAEGNGDSISAAIQAERISLLTSVLAQTQLSGNNATFGSAAQQGLRSHSATPPHPHYLRKSPGLHNSVHRSHSHTELTSQRNVRDANSQPIYQTSGHRRPSPLYTAQPDTTQGQQTQTPPSLLPSFLQDIVQSPTLTSMSSASSADLSFEDEKTLTQNDCGVPAKQDSASSSPSANIWRLDSEESRSLMSPTQQDLAGTRKVIPLMFHISQAA